MGGSILLPYTTLVIDVGDYLFRRIFFRTHRNKTQEKTPNLDERIAQEIKPYKILMSVYNFGSHLPEFYGNWMKDYKDRILMIDDSSPDNTVEVARSLGLEIWEKAVNLRKPHALRHLIRHLDPSIETVILMDPDTRIVDRDSFEKVLYQFQQTGADASSVQLMPYNEDNLVSRLQVLEYQKTMTFGRGSLRDESIISGGCALFKRRTIEEALDRHSGEQTGEDFELSLDILNGGGKISHIDQVIAQTEVPSTWRDLWKQRVIWGEADITVQWKFLPKPRKTLKSFYNQYIYNLGLCTLMQPLKIASLPFLLTSAANTIDYILGTNVIPNSVNFFGHEVSTHPLTFLGFYSFYVAFEAFDLATNRLKNKKTYAKLLPLFPLYKLYVTIFPRTVGMINGIKKLFKKDKSIHVPYFPKDDISNYGGLRHNQLQVSGVDKKLMTTLYGLPKKDPERWERESQPYRAVFYGTQYHDLYLIRFTGNIPPLFLGGHSPAEVHEHLFLGVDKDDKRIYIYPLNNVRSILPKKDFVLEGVPFKVQEGRYLQIDDETVRHYQDRFIDTGLVVDRTDYLVSNKLIGFNTSNGNIASQRESYQPLTLRINNSNEGLEWDFMVK